MLIQMYVEIDFDDFLYFELKKNSSWYTLCTDFNSNQNHIYINILNYISKSNDFCIIMFLF